MQAKYDESYYASNAQDRDRPALWFYSRIWRKYCGEGPVLEFGSGVGFFAKRLSLHAETYGLEINQYAIERFKINAPDARIVQSLKDIPTASLGSIVSLHVLEHISDVELLHVGAEFNRMLKPGGRVLVVVPDLTGTAAEAKGSSWMGFRDPTHINLKGSAAWEQWFEREWQLNVIRSAADGYYSFPYGKTITGRVFGDAYRLLKTAFQFLVGRLVLHPGDGEAAIFLLEKR